MAIGLFRELAQEQRGNVMVSPYSLEAVLRLLEQGATGQMKQLLAELPAGRLDVPSALVVRSANALFVASDLELNGDFRDVVRAPFATDPAAATRQINAWCDKQTQGNIPTLVTEGNITPQTRLVAANAIWLKERWLRPFEKLLTHPQTFTGEDGLGHPVPMMQQTARFAYAEGADWKAVALPYRGQEPGEPGCTIAILPTQAARDFAASLTKEKWDTIRKALASAQPQEVSVTLPKLELRSDTIRLRPALERMGLPALFGQGGWTGFTSEPMALDDILQRCYVLVDETGTAAAAATAAVAIQTALGPRPVSIRFDRPFLWVIGDLRTAAAPYFMGLITQLSSPQSPNQNCTPS